MQFLIPQKPSIQILSVLTKYFQYVKAGLKSISLRTVMKQNNDRNNQPNRNTRVNQGRVSCEFFRIVCVLILDLFFFAECRLLMQSCVQDVLRIFDSVWLNSKYLRYRNCKKIQFSCSLMGECWELIIF